jgi:hypothetical protein
MHALQGLLVALLAKSSVTIRILSHSFADNGVHENKRRIID